MKKHLWECNECHATQMATLKDVNEVGTPHCAMCDKPMELVDGPAFEPDKIPSVLERYAIVSEYINNQTEANWIKMVRKIKNIK